MPIGAYSYSQGLERVVEDGRVRDAGSAQAWIGDLLELSIAAGEAAIAWRLLTSASDRDWPLFTAWNARFRASRETAEILAETLQMGTSLAKLAGDLDLLDDGARGVLRACEPPTLPAAYALGARGFGVPAEGALTAYVWSWVENQVLAAIKLVPLGQLAGQRMLVALGATIPGVVATASTIADDRISMFAPGLALASARHETQYTRLFRS